jgi:hypothetical protein
METHEENISQHAPELTDSPEEVSGAETAADERQPEVSGEPEAKPSRKEKKLAKLLDKATLTLEKAILKESSVRDAFEQSKVTMQKAHDDLAIILSARPDKKKVKELKKALKAAKKSFLKLERTLDKAETKRKNRQKDLKKVRKKLIG